MGLRRSWWNSFFGVPHGLPGRLGIRLMPRTSRPFHTAMAAVLDLQPDDELVDVGCGSATLFTAQATHVRYVAGLDASALQLELARRRLAGRIAAGTAEIVEGDATRLPWDDGRFSVATSINVLKFVPDPLSALREIHRVLRPGGRLAVTLGEAGEAPADSMEGVVDTWGQWQWSDIAAQRLLEDAGFTDVVVEVMPVFSKALLARGTKAASEAAAADAAEPTEATPVAEPVA
jgi:ubiquinone/menaquinone biosynthesis C-methylase UbiE